MEALTQEAIDLLLGSVRERGAYKRFFEQFQTSDVQGTNVSEAFPGKKSATLYQGMNSARKELDAESTVRVINHEDTVYLIKTGSVNGASAE
jgi:hypothetical protein